MLKLEFDARQLCLDLLHADTEEQVIRILDQHGYWNDSNAWRLFGNTEGNYSTIGNQANNADVPIVEKLVNSVDAVLMGECGSAGIKPNSPGAPGTLHEAVAKFFHGDISKADSLGHISNWFQQRRREVSDRITLAATGTRQNPSFTIVDNGEGQTPQSMPNTLLSLDKQNKVDVHFVQGKFNMGGTGALRFCGHHNLQLIISRRNPNILPIDTADESSGQWGFTVVRREDPTDSKRVSTYTYLAPELDGVLHFNADSLPLFPEADKAYNRETSWGTAVKLYEYKITGRSHILRGDGLLQRLDLLLPRIALPVRLHECRGYSGHPGSFDTTLNGLGVRLSDDRSENLEPGFPTSGAFTIRGEQMTAEVYAFKRGKADTYKGSEGIIFTVNGQTHGSLDRRFFGRRSVRMNRLEDSILVIVDCSHISGRNREDLFMNSRDRMQQGEFLTAIEHELESAIKNDQLLRSLGEQRRREDITSKLEDSKPFKEVLEKILSKSPSLASLFGGTGPLPDPFKSIKANSGNEFLGRPHPSYFRFRDMDYGKELQRTTAINMRSRVAFETDVVNDYFTRGQYQGKHSLRPIYQSLKNTPVPDHTLNLQNGIATLNLSLPDGAKVGDSFRYELIVEESTLVEPFVNSFVVSVGPHQEPSGGSGNGRRQSNNGDGNSESPQGLAIPTPILVHEPEWDKHGFDRNSALKAVYDPSDDQDVSNGYHTYYINMDNIYLNTELKATKENPDIVKARWQYGMVLIGLALLRNDKSSEVFDNNGQASERDDSKRPEDVVYNATAAIAPVLLPLIEHLGGLSDEDVTS